MPWHQRMPEVGSARSSPRPQRQVVPTHTQHPACTHARTRHAPSRLLARTSPSATQQQPTSSSSEEYTLRMKSAMGVSVAVLLHNSCVGRAHPVHARAGA